jgi:hypothetical protein
MKREIQNRGAKKPTPAQVWAVRKGNGIDAIFERWGNQWSQQTLRNLSNMGRLEEAAKDEEIETEI